MITASSWKLVEPEHWPWKDFSPYEMACKGDGSLKVEESFMDKLQALRNAAGFPFTINSGYRSDAYNATLKDSVAHDAHTQGRAVDIAVQGEHAFKLLGLAAQFGFTGIGIKQAGPSAGRFIHLDDMESTPDAPRVWCWSYNT